jgi:hypothetical protein
MKIQYYSFWSSFGHTNDVLHTYFQKLFNGFEFDVIEIWSVFGPEPMSLNDNPKKLTVQWSNEATFKNPNRYNINLIPMIPGKNVVPDFSITSIHEYPKEFTEKRIWDKNTRNRFCNFIVSNGGPVERKQFFLELSKHKCVDSCGKLLPNWKGEQPSNWWTKEYLEFLGSWKFMICFENKKFDYYITEKITNAYRGGCIPIYWGCSQIKELFNEKAILLLEEFTPEAINALIDKIMELENNETLYQQMYNEPLFKNNEIPKEFTVEYLRSQILEKIK